MRRILVLFLALTLTLGSVTGALAAWVTSGTGTAESSAGSLPRGSTPTVPTDSTGSVELNWAATTPPAGVTLDGYRVERHAVGETDPLEFTPAGGSCTGTVEALTCTDEDVPEGDWQYRVSPGLAEWYGERSYPSSSVSVGTAATMHVSSIGTHSERQGQSSNWKGTFTVNVESSLGADVEGTVTVHYTLSGGVAVSGTCQTTTSSCPIDFGPTSTTTPVTLTVEDVSGPLTYVSEDDITSTATIPRPF